MLGARTPLRLADRTHGLAVASQATGFKLDLDLVNQGVAFDRGGLIRDVRPHYSRDGVDGNGREATECDGGAKSHGGASQAGEHSCCGARGAERRVCRNGGRGHTGSERAKVASCVRRGRSSSQQAEGG
jgi:hypothetical protein